MNPTHLMRVRLNDRLAAAARFHVTIIVAPAGFGKSVALRDYLETARIDALRLDVRREDDSHIAFAARLSETIAPVAPGAPSAFIALRRQAGGDLSPADLALWFNEYLRRAVCTIVIDDLHFASGDPRTAAMLVDLIERTPDHVRWMIATRSDSGFPVASWTAYGRMELPIGENDLRFSPQEALAAAEEAQAAVDSAEIEELRELTGGWAVALSIALRTRTYAADLRSAAATTREMLYRYLAEQVYTRFDASERELLLATSPFSTFTRELAGALGASEEQFERLHTGTALVFEVAPGEYRYHDLFRDFLEATLIRRGERAWHDVLIRAGDIARDRGALTQALDQYLRARDDLRVASVLRDHGLALFERGEGERLRAALDAIGERRSADALFVGLGAMLDAHAGDFRGAARGFDRAIPLASGELRAVLAQRFAVELLRHERDCIALLEPIVREDGVSAQQQSVMLGTLAGAYVRAGRIDDAREAIERALRMIPEAGDDVRARLYAQAAYVAEGSGDHRLALEYAKRAIDIAQSEHLYEILARTYLFVFDDAIERDDVIDALSALDKMSEAAIKSGSRQAKFYALVAAYDLEAERGNEARLRELDGEIDTATGNAPIAYLRSVLPARALQAGWNGEFERAHDTIAVGTLDEEPERRLLRLAEVALYAAAAGRHEISDDAVARAAAILDEIPGTTRRAIRSRVLLALALLLRGHAAAAHRHLGEAERSTMRASSRQRALVAAGRAYYRLHLGQTDGASVAAALERMRSEHLGGLARLFDVLPLRTQGEGSSYAALTQAEREILALLVTAENTKAIAAATGRSPHTIDTHVRSICKKLGCRGRREAVTLAVRSGWV